MAASPAIHLVTEIPGPKSRALVARREAATPPGAAKLTPIAIERAHGAVVTDVDGNRYLDLAGGIGTLAVGHTPGPVVDAIKEQVDKLIHMCFIVGTYEAPVALCERLNAIAPGAFPKRTVLMNSGAEALETAVLTFRSFSVSFVELMEVPTHPIMPSMAAVTMAAKMRVI